MDILRSKTFSRSFALATHPRGESRILDAGSNWCALDTVHPDERSLAEHPDICRIQSLCPP